MLAVALFGVWTALLVRSFSLSYHLAGIDNRVYNSLPLPTPPRPTPVFIAFATLSGSNAISGFNAAAEIKNRNVAAGTLWALQTISLGAIISNAVLKSDSIVTFFVWSLLGTLLLLLVRIFVDKLVRVTHATAVHATAVLLS